MQDNQLLFTQTASASAISISSISNPFIYHLI